MSHPTDTDVTDPEALRRVWGPPDATQRVDASGPRDDTTRRFGPAPTAPPPVPPSPSASRTSGRRPGLPLRSYLAVALTAALGAGAVIVPTQLGADDVAEAPAASTATPATTGETAESDPAGDGSTAAEPLPGADAGSQIAAIAERLKPSVVRIDVGSGSGSGVVLDSDGRVLTNAHVVGDATTVTVQTPGGEQLEGRVVGADDFTDIAVVEVDSSLPVPTYSTAEPTVGESAIAIGSPFRLDSTVTSGIISAVGRSLDAAGSTLYDLVQTDAAINPGNSGGALVNGRGQVIGINTAIISASGANDGIGFAVPAGTALSVADELIRYGEVRAGWLGVEGRTIDPQVAELYDLQAESGAVIVNVLPDTPAAAAGLQEGDIVVAVDDDEVTSMTDLASIVRERDPGDEVTLRVMRADQELELQLTLGDRPADVG